MNTNPDAKRILIYGDSFTFGKIPGAGRYKVTERFTGILQTKLGQDYEIIEEGLRGRTLSGENKFFKFRNGEIQFGPILGSHLPIDLLVILLGTNDCNSGCDKTETDFSNAINEYKNQIKFWTEQLGFEPPKVLLLAPPLIEEKFSYALFNDLFKGAKEKSSKLGNIFDKIAEENGFKYFDTSKIVKPSEVDGIHLDQENNKILGQELAKVIINIWDT